MLRRSIRLSSWSSGSSGDNRRGKRGSSTPFCPEALLEAHLRTTPQVFCFCGLGLYPFVSAAARNPRRRESAERQLLTGLTFTDVTSLQQPGFFSTIGWEKSGSNVSVVKRISWRTSGKPYCDSLERSLTFRISLRCHSLMRGPHVPVPRQMIAVIPFTL